MITEGMYTRENMEFNALIMPNDNLFITVSAINPEAIEVFNPSLLHRGGTLSTTTLDVMGYLVDQRGNINFPVVGEIHLGGLTKKEAVQLLQRAVSKYVTDPVINIRFLNYKISILGEVNRPGVYTVTDERITVPQALSMAGDLTIYGDRRHVQLQRMENGEKRFYFIDLTTPDIFFSPNFYLLQNDILYIPPNSTRAGLASYNQTLPFLMSIMSLSFTILQFFIRNNNK